MKSIFKGKIVKYINTFDWDKNEYIKQKRMQKLCSEKGHLIHWNLYSKPKLYTDEEIVEMKTIHETDNFTTIIKDEYIEINNQLLRIDKYYYNQDGAVVYYLDIVIENVTDEILTSKNNEEKLKYVLALKEQEDIDKEVEQCIHDKLAEDDMKKNEYIRKNGELNDPDDFGKTHFWNIIFKKLFK